MGIKDMTLSENIHTITAAIENKQENFDTENKMREDSAEKNQRSCTRRRLRRTMMRKPVHM